MTEIYTFDKALHLMPRKSQGILSRESPQTERFHTAWVMSRNTRDRQNASALPSTETSLPTSFVMGPWRAAGCSKKPA